MEPVEAMSQYERIRILGTGTFGQCWLARAKATSRLLVIKEVRVRPTKTKKDGEKEEA